MLLILQGGDIAIRVLETIFRVFNAHDNTKLSKVPSLAVRRRQRSEEQENRCRGCTEVDRGPRLMEHLLRWSAKALDA